MTMTEHDRAAARAKAFDLFTHMFDELTEPNVEGFRRCYDKMCDTFPLPDDATFEEIEVAGVRCIRTTIDGVAPQRTILYLHGGGYMCGNPDGVREPCARLARAARATVIAADYRLAPEAAFPAAVEDGLAVYSALVAQVGAGALAVVGDSAGAGLAMGTVLRARDEAVALPAAIGLFSPWVDPTASGSTIATKAEVDPVASRDSLLMSAEAYLQGQDPEHPYVNILRADLAGLPPMLIQAGSEEVLLDDAVRLARAAGEAQVEVTLEIVPGMPHIFQYFGSFLPEADEAITRTAEFIVARAAA